MTDQKLPDLDYVSRCIWSLEDWKSYMPEGSLEWTTLSDAINICNAYQQVLPHYKSILPNAQMPPRKNSSNDALYD